MPAQIADPPRVELISRVRVDSTQRIRHALREKFALPPYRNAQQGRVIGSLVVTC